MLCQSLWDAAGPSIVHPCGVKGMDVVVRTIAPTEKVGVVRLRGTSRSRTSAQGGRPTLGRSLRPVIPSRMRQSYNRSAMQLTGPSFIGPAARPIAVETDRDTPIKRPTQHPPLRVLGRTYARGSGRSDEHVAGVVRALQLCPARAHGQPQPHGASSLDGDDHDGMRVGYTGSNR